MTDPIDPLCRAPLQELERLEAQATASEPVAVLTRHLARIHHTLEVLAPLDDRGRVRPDWVRLFQASVQAVAALSAVPPTSSADAWRDTRARLARMTDEELMFLCNLKYWELLGAPEGGPTKFAEAQRAEAARPLIDRYRPATVSDPSPTTVADTGTARHRSNDGRTHEDK